MIAMEKRPRQVVRIAVRPHCPEHGDTMYAGSSRRLFTYYYCQNHACSHSVKVPRVYTPIKRSTL